MSLTSMRRKPCYGVVVVLVLAATMLAAGGSAPVNAASSFAGYAEARGLTTVVVNASIPAVGGAEVTVPFTTTTLNSLGQSDSYASAPYPGAVVANLFDLAGALVPLPVPEYPLQVVTSAGDDPKDVNFPGVSLHAESGASLAAAKATVVSDPTGLTSRSRVEILADGSMKSSADFSADAVQLGGLVKLHGVKTHVSALADAFSGELTRSSELSIGRISIPALNLRLPEALPPSISVPVPVPGLPQLPPIPLPPLPIPAVGGMQLQDPTIGYTNGQFHLTLPFLGNQVFALPTEVLTQALEPLGISLTVMPAEASTTGVIGSALTIETTLPAPPENPLINSPTFLSVTLGTSRANADLRPSLETEGFVLPGVDLAGGGAGGSGVDVNGLDGSGLDRDASPGDFDVASESPGALPPEVAEAAGPGSLAGSSDNSVGSSTFGLKLAGSSLSGLAGIYLLLVSVAVLAFVAANFLRLTGVRSRWI